MMENENCSTYQHDYAIDTSCRALFKPGIDVDTHYFAIKPLPIFQSSKLRYNSINAWYCAELSRWSYRNYQSLEGALVNTPFTLLNISVCYQMKIALLRVDDHLPNPSYIIVLSGSQGGLHWGFNSLFWQTPWQLLGLDQSAHRHETTKVGAKVHYGFHALSSRVLEHIEPMIMKLPTHSTLYICGHSLGGAVAQWVARALYGRFELACYTYGAPLLGNRPFALDDPLKHHYRVINYRDIISALPLWPMDYESTGVTQYINYAQEIVTQPSLVELKRDRALKNRYPLRGLKNPLPECLVNHAPINYVTHLANILCRTAQ